MNMRITNNVRILSMFLSLLMILGALSSLTILPVFAAEADAEADDELEEVVTDEPATSEDTPATDEIPSTDETPSTGDAPVTDGEEDAPVYIGVEDAILTYLTNEYESKEDKLASMTPKLSYGDLQLYVDVRTGEVAVRNTKTGQIMTSNPYDVASVNDETEIKYSTIKNELLSQVFISFTDLANGNIKRDMNSFADCAQYGQIKVKNIKNGLRVEYTLGKLSTKKLLPYWIEASRFESMILEKIEDDYEQSKFVAYYNYINNNEVDVETILKSNIEKYPCTGKSYKSNGYTPTVTQTTFLNSIGQETTHDYTTAEEWQYMVIYAIDSKQLESERVTNLLEGYTKTYSPEYNYEEQDFDVQLTGYVGNESAAATFTLALEYSLGEEGLTVRLPANGISFNEDAYQLNSVSVLKYMGATSNDYTGYTFLPDGSGTIIRNEDMVDYGLTYTLSGEVYGPDYAYHTLTYNGKSEIFRLPVFGTVEDTAFYTDEVIGKEVVYQLDDNGNIVTDQAGNKIPEYVKYDNEARPVARVKNAEGTYVYAYIDTLTEVIVTETPEEPTTAEDPVTSDEVAEAAEEGATDTETTQTVTYEWNENSVEAPVVGIANASTGETVLYEVDENGNRIRLFKDIYASYTVSQGMVAIITAGESLATITSSHGGGQTHKYNAVYASFSPLSTDTYNLADAISVGNDATWTVTSERKYTGSLEITYIMLYDHEDYEYEGSYTGMAKAYQDHLVKNNGLELLSNTAADIPLYIESFGMLETQDTFLTFPVWVDTPLTTMDDIQSMRDQLAGGEYAITNIHFRLKGFNEGGMDTSYAPTLVDFEKVLGGNSGYNKLVEDAAADGYYVYPEFDFANVQNDKWFDCFDYSDQTVRTIDDRYTSKREYDATYQSFQRVSSVAISPWAYDEIVDGFIEEFKDQDLKVSGISASTLGTDLNSDFDQDDPYNREDNKEFTIAALKKLQENFGNLMIDGGNAYTLGYVSHILNMPLDGSRYLRASQAIPFMGMVLHGYVQYAGSPTNMEGDTAYEILKIIENGASPYFMLSYQNTNELKESYTLSDYYSVNFQIWLEDMREIYQTVNEALKDVQNVTITSHEFIDGERKLSEAEQAQKDAADQEAAAAYTKAYNAALITAIKTAATGGLITVPEGHQYLNADGSVNMEGITGFDLFTFEAEFNAANEGKYVSGFNTVIDDKTIVYEVYGDSVGFILNYNNFDVTVTVNGEVYEIGALDFIKISVASQD